jgi:hypothetical protein
VNGKKEEGVYKILGPFQFSPDGQHTAYGAVRLKAGFASSKAFGTVVVDGKESGQYEVRATGTVTTGPQPLDSFHDSVSSPVYSLDGRHLVYIAQFALGRAVVVVDGKPGPEFSQIIVEPALSRDGEHMGYLAMQDKVLVQVLNGKVTALGDVVPAKSFSFAESAEISPDGLHLGSIVTKTGFGYTAGSTHARRRMLVDGKPEKEYDCMEMSPLMFSSDSLHHAYFVKGIKGRNEKSLFVVDGFEGPLYDSIPAGVSFRFQGPVITFVGLRDGVRYRISQQAP